MGREVQVTLRGYTSASGYNVDWSSDDKLLQTEFEPEPKHSWSSTSWLDTFKLEPGDYLFVIWYQNDDDDLTALIQVPTGAEFEKFVEAAAKAEQAKRRDDGWIHDFAVSVWAQDAEDWPMDLAEATEWHNQKSS